MKPPITPQESGSRGGRAGRGPSKVRPLSPDKARHMAALRWANHKQNQKKG